MKEENEGGGRRMKEENAGSRMQERMRSGMGSHVRIIHAHFHSTTAVEFQR